MAVTKGRVVLTPGSEKPYVVVLDHHPSGTSEHPVSTIREGEALIRSELHCGVHEKSPVEAWHI